MIINNILYNKNTTEAYIYIRLRFVQMYILLSYLDLKRSVYINKIIL